MFSMENVLQSELKPNETFEYDELKLSEDKILSKLVC